ncbi:MAG: Rrf2 family transcriptional regulator [Nannocystaceae bacterium]|nr:Rrf2 family transcriptional regulator [Nannocystaceae bacterium]
MRRDGRLSAALHLLLHLERSEVPMTSAALSKVMDTNPVVIRRMLAGIRDAGYVRSDKGHGGGWTLACEMSQLSLRDIYDALGRPTVFAVGHRKESPDCLVEQAVNASLTAALDEAEAVLLARFADVSLDQIASDVQKRLRARKTQQRRRQGTGGCGHV